LYGPYSLKPFGEEQAIEDLQDRKAATMVLTKVAHALPE